MVEGLVVHTVAYFVEQRERRIERNSDRRGPCAHSMRDRAQRDERCAARLPTVGSYDASKRPPVEIDLRASAELLERIEGNERLAIK